jgi:hypothetical protein
LHVAHISDLHDNRNPNAETLLERFLIDATGPALDRALFSTVPAGAERPGGLLHGITQLSSTSSLTDDLMALIAAVSPVAGNGQIVSSPRLIKPQRLPSCQEPRGPC